VTGATTADRGPAPSYTILNGTAASDPSSEAPTAAASTTPTDKTPPSQPEANKVAFAAGAAGAAAKGATATAAKNECRVWQASYGGQKAVIIQAIDGARTNYTVLDVNEGREQREVAAYIAAYAKGGTQVAEFQSSSKALVKAFEMCPESPES